MMARRDQPRFARVIAIALVAGVVCACRGSQGQGLPDLGIDNATTLPVTVVVNGGVVGTFAPGTHEHVAADTLPTLPWRVDLRSPTGRMLLHLDVPVGSVWSTTNPDGSFTEQGAGTRVDLSCGRLDVYVGPPLGGPMAGPGVAGDCEP